MKTIHDYHMERIHKSAENIRRELTGGFLFGEPIDPDNQDMVLVAAVCIASQKVRHEASAELLDLLDALP